MQGLRFSGVLISRACSMSPGPRGSQAYPSNTRRKVVAEVIQKSEGKQLHTNAADIAVAARAHGRLLRV